MRINELNYKEYLLAHLEAELSPAEAREAEAYILLNNAAGEEWARLKATRLQPDTRIVFAHKAKLMKVEEADEATAAPLAEEKEPARIIPLTYRRLATVVSIAAIFLIGLYAVVTYNSKTAINEVAGMIQRPVDKKVKPADISVNAAQELADDVAPAQVKAEVSDDQINKVMQSHRASLPVADKVKPLKRDKHILQENKEEVPLEGQRPVNSDNIAIVPDGATPPPVKAVTGEIKEDKHFAQASPAPRSTISPKDDLAENALAMHAGQAEASHKLELADKEDKPLIKQLFSLFGNKVKISRVGNEPENKYALSINTDRINLNKTFKANF